jgi:hypothetical protein
MAGEERGPDVVAVPPFIYLAPLVAGLILDRLIPLPRLPGRVTRPIGAVALGGGVALMGWFLGTMRRADTPVDVREAPRHLAVEGPFQYTRNPCVCRFCRHLSGHLPPDTGALAAAAPAGCARDRRSWRDRA